VGLGAVPAAGAGLGWSEHPASIMVKSIAAAPSAAIANDFDIIALSMQDDDEHISAHPSMP